MNLESRMKEKADLHNQFGNKGYNCIPLRDAIKITQEYAEEMCRKQREICQLEYHLASHPYVYKLRIKEWDEIKSAILNAPLATEAQDGK